METMTPFISWVRKQTIKGFAWKIFFCAKMKFKNLRSERLSEMPGVRIQCVESTVESVTARSLTELVVSCAFLLFIAQL